MKLIRGSELNDFLRCRLRWSYAWTDNLESKRPNNKLAFGTLVHKYLEAWYNSGLDNGAAWNAMTALWNEEDYYNRMDLVEVNEMETMLEQVTKNYATHYGTMEQDGNWEVVATELTFAIPLDDEIGYTGTIDLIVRDKKDGRIYFLDHKTTQSIDKYDKNSDMDRQISRYWWALNQLAEENGYIWCELDNQWESAAAYRGVFDKPSGFIYNIILKDFPVPPKVLKDGSLSKAKNQNTTYEVYIEALNEKGFPYSDYEEILTHLVESPKEYFRRIEVRRNQAEIDAAIQEFFYTAHDIKRVESTVKLGYDYAIYRNITSDCHWDCPYMALCKAGLDGSDTEYLKDELYKEKEEQTWHFKL